MENLYVKQQQRWLFLVALALFIILGVWYSMSIVISREISGISIILGAIFIIIIIFCALNLIFPEYFSITEQGLQYKKTLSKNLILIPWTEISKISDRPDPVSHPDVDFIKWFCLGFSTGEKNYLVRLPLSDHDRVKNILASFIEKYSIQTSYTDLEITRNRSLIYSVILVIVVIFALIVFLRFYT